MTLKEQIKYWAVKKVTKATAEGYISPSDLVEILFSYKRVWKLNKEELTDILKIMVSENIEGRMDEDYDEDLAKAIKELDFQLKISKEIKKGNSKPKLNLKGKAVIGKYIEWKRNEHYFYAKVVDYINDECGEFYITKNHCIVGVSEVTSILESLF